ncbi:DUF2971 domain-containing protein [Olleya namhaensis]|uniref:DUF2971 domain-containing protein n=1 Tax=Olleya namhaensis TaxID=1144750 RepID=UPI00232B609C|nr:DUF2971 domain-containing protein [Olleya namhaensis]
MFKYYTIPEKDSGFVIEKIIGFKPTVKFSPAFHMNDPFEYKFNLKIDVNSKVSEKKYFEKFPKNTIDDYRKWQKGISDNFTWYNEQEIRKYSAITYNLCSFSEKNNNNLMWSHYTNNHKGFCVEYSDELFDFFKSNKKFLACGKVNYSQSPPLVESFEEDESKLFKIFFNKQLEWKYEEEFRVLFKCNGKTEFVEIENKFIKSVFIGSKCDAAFSDKIIDVCSRNNIKIFHGITMGKTYEIEFEEHEEGKIFMKSFWN